MKRNIKNITGFFALLAMSSCNNFLDELPDNRTSLDNGEKIKRILVSAYPSRHYAVVAESSSDNIEDMGELNPNTTRFYTDIAYWKATNETDNDALKNVWETHYKAISAANEALDAIQTLGNPPELSPLRGEALITRAYNHFVLVNLFCNHYNTETSATDLGIPYMEKPEKTLNPKYERGTVKQVYEKINADIEESLPLIRDNVYQVPKYHFNRAASYAFAARFNLFYEQWQKAVDYASVALGNDPASVVRNWEALSKLPRTPDAIGHDYISVDKISNLLLQTSYSSAGVVYGAYYTNSRFNHSNSVANRETIAARGPWGSYSSNTFWHRPISYSTTNLDKFIFMKIPNLFQYTDIVAQIGYRRVVHALFTTDETLLVRAEANIILKNYSDAVNDLNVWSKAMLRNGRTFTQTQLETFYGGLAYSSETAITQKKKLNPKFTIEAGTQENLLHCVLQYRRILTLHEGLRWFDIRRYGIEVPRFQVQTGGSRIVTDRLTLNDLRRTFQIPDDIIKAGITPNPR